MVLGTLARSEKNFSGFQYHSIILILCQNHAIAIKNSRKHDLIGSKTTCDIDCPLPTAIELSFKFDENLPLAKIFEIILVVLILKS